MKTVQTKITVTSIYNKTKSAVTLFASWAQRAIKCEDYQTIESFNKAVNNIQTLPAYHGSNIRNGLESGLHSLMNDGCGEENIKRIIILILDGDGIDGIDGEKGLIEASKAIQEAGITIFALTIGQPRFTNRQLLNIVSSTDNILPLVVGYNDPNFVDELMNIICKI